MRQITSGVVGCLILDVGGLPDWCVSRGVHYKVDAVPAISLVLIALATIGYRQRI